MNDIHVKVEVSIYAKCQRCRRYLPEVGKIYKWPDLCWRCADVMDSFEATNPALYNDYVAAMENHPMRKATHDNPQIKRLLSKSGKILEVWFPKEMMTWGEFIS